MFKFLRKKAFLIFILFATALSSYAQTDEVQMADGMRANGKIYVVVAVVAVVLLGLFVFLINIDRKISRLEKENNKR